MAETEEMNQPATPDSKTFQLETKIFDMAKYGLKAIDRFPARDRKTASDIRRYIFDMMELIVAIERKYYKKTTLQDLDIKLGVLKQLVIMASDKDYYNEPAVKKDKEGRPIIDKNGKTVMTVFPPPLDMQKRRVWNGMNVEIGKMIGGYMKTAK